MRWLVVFLVACSSMTQEADDQVEGCQGLGEDVCRATTSCHASYEEPGLSPPGETYIGCATLAEVLTLPTGVCSTLGEHDCGARSDCVTWYRPGPTDGAVFEDCRAE